MDLMGLCCDLLGAYDVMSSKHLKGDFNYAWPGAEVPIFMRFSSYFFISYAMKMN